VILDALRAMARRWYIVLAGLLLTAGLAWGAFQSSPAEYQARGLVLLLPGPNAVPEGGNPFLALSGLEQPASIVVAYFGSAAAQAEVAEVSDSADFSVQLDASTRGPVIAIDVTDNSAEGTIATLDFLTQRVPEELERLQAELAAPADSVITSMPLVVDDEPEQDNSGTIRITIAALAAGIVLTGVAVFTLDGVIMRRRTRRKARAAALFPADEGQAIPDQESPAPDAKAAGGPDGPDGPDGGPDADSLSLLTVEDEPETEGTDPDDSPTPDDDETEESSSARPGPSRSARHRASNPASGSGAPTSDAPRIDARAGRHR